MDVEPNMIPPQRIGDREYRAQFPAFEMVSGTNGVSSAQIRRMLSSWTPLPENRFSSTGNNSRYRNPENDDRAVPDDDPARRSDGALRDLVHHRTDQLPSMGLFYEVEFTIYDERLSNITSRGPRSSQTWNAQLWELRR